MRKEELEKRVKILETKMAVVFSALAIDDETLSQPTDGVICDCCSTRQAVRWEEGYPSGCREAICAICANAFDNDNCLWVCPKCKMPGKMIEYREDDPDIFICESCGIRSDATAPQQEK